MWAMFHFFFKKMVTQAKLTGVESFNVQRPKAPQWLQHRPKAGAQVAGLNSGLCAVTWKEST